MSERLEFNRLSVCLFVLQNNNNGEEVQLDKEELQEAVNQANLEADSEYQSEYRAFNHKQRFMEIPFVWKQQPIYFCAGVSLNIHSFIERERIFLGKFHSFESNSRYVFVLGCR